ncbi:TPA: AAA family ATPase [Bacillus mycoides]|uniref:AAA family ATPase n=1 Tax=Bacillus TaxID=1386 RepID=UPI000991B63F|nr:AAA family ATPase [Bacillus mycoides]HDR7588505.1 AAA family ATPase [Bacillus mycoides]HDR7590622.1 AAA family ATPase [Bacillus mycoides]
MKIAYLWIEKLQNRINVDFNLGSEYFFQFEKKTNTLHVEDNNYYTSGFYNVSQENNIEIDINAIVGENGTGKTTILEAIRDIVSNKLKNKYLIIYEESGRYIYKAPHKIKINSPKLTLNVPDNTLPTINSLYYSNVFDVRYVSNLFNHQRIRETKDYTTNILLRRSNDIYEFFSQELTMQVEFAMFFKDQPFASRFHIPKEIIFRINKNHTILDSLPKTLKEVINEITKYKFLKLLFKDKFDEKCSKSSIKGFYINYAKSILLYYIYSIIDFMELSHPNMDLWGLYSKFINALQTIMQQLENNPNFKLEDFKSIVSLNIIDHHQNAKTTLSKYPTLQFLKHLENECKQLVNLVFVDSIHTEESIYSIKYLFKQLTKPIIDIFTKWQKMKLGSLEWYSLSSGEYALLSMFSRIFNAANQLERSSIPNLVLLLIDEGELYFHPQWQKEWITILIECLNKIFEHHNIFIQVILTTHSPFLLSDITMDRVLFLENDYDNNVHSKNYLDDIHHTFGANINYLYTHSFFLKGSLMGDFAKNKINALADEIINNTPEYILENSDNIRRKIHLIGEPLLKQKLISLYEQQLKLIKPTQLMIQEEIKLLKNRLETLEKIQGEKSK